MINILNQESFYPTVMSFGALRGSFNGTTAIKPVSVNSNRFYKKNT